MPDRSIDHVRDMKKDIAQIRSLFSDRAFEQVWTDVVTRAAFERFLEILSDRSRLVPASWKEEQGPKIQWAKIAGLGDQIHYDYDRIDVRALWSVYQNDLTPLEQAIDTMIAAHAPEGGPS